jgi:septum formation protein
MQFVLASASSARKRLLQTVGIEPIVRPSHFDESQIQLTDPGELVQALAVCKAETVAAAIVQDQPSLPVLILGCDSVLAMHGEIYGKPANAEVAIARWQQMQGQVGHLYTGHALISLSPGTEKQAIVRCQVTEVHFAPVSNAQIRAYVATREPLYCAGGFALEGKGGLFVEKLVGCHTNVIGLSLPLLRQMLEQIGYDVTVFWQ